VQAADLLALDNVPLAAAQAAGTLVLDVRTPQEFAGGHVPGAVNVPIDELRDRLGEIDASKRVIAYCQVGLRGYLATRILQQAGRDAANLSGGYTTYCQWQDECATA